MSKRDNASKKRKKDRQKAQRARVSSQFKKEESDLNDLRKKGPYIKQIMAARGHMIHFFDYLDSYSDAFHSIAEDAVRDYVSLLGVHELDDAEEEGVFWESLGYENLTQIFFSIGEGMSDYGREHGKGKSNLEGAMTAFHDNEGAVRSLISIRRNIKSSVRHPELKYALKIASLLHEIGHVKDLELEKNMNVKDKAMDVIEAEVYAHLFALDEMAKRHMRHSFDILLGGIGKMALKEGYMAHIGCLVLERLPEYQIPDWNTLFFESPPSEKELKMIGPVGRAILVG